VSTTQVLFAGVGLTEAEAQERCNLISRFYDAEVSVRWEGRLLCGRLEVDPLLGPCRRTQDWWWGEPPPPSLSSERSVVNARDAELRHLDGGQAVFAVSGERARIVQGAGAPMVVATARRAGVTAWATHAVCASLLASGGAEIDVASVRDLLVLNAPTGERTLLEGVKLLRAATAVDIDVREGTVTRTWSFWPVAERWAAPDASPEELLLASVAGRVEHAPEPWIALTGGRDSSALVSTAVRGGLRLPTFTWGGTGWPDVDAARRSAAVLGLHHEAYPYVELPDGDAVTYCMTLARDTDGIAPTGSWARQEVPHAMTSMITGAGGEVGRAYFYTATAKTRRHPRPRHLAADLCGNGPVDVRSRVRDVVERAAEETGIRGWELLDVFYVDHRMGRWARGRLAPMSASVFAPYVTPPVAASLVALPRELRLATGWHRRATDPRITMPVARLQRRGVPPWVRRAASAYRRRRRSEEPGRWPWADIIFEARPTLRAWMHDELLGAESIRAAIGEKQVTELRNGFQRGERIAVERAMALGGAAALELALAGLAAR
jgi:Asparagine synthase